ncbi:MAG: ribonuclease HI family protein [Nitrospinae bacterium]|nr:ribonuclease HI family protein [Nitrospinota bacterium]
MVKVFIDGASRGNPGKGGAGIVFYDQEGRIILEMSQYLGQTTNNEAEYKALILAMERLSQESGKIKEVEVYSDSELMTRQINGRYCVRSDSLKRLYKEVKDLIKRFEGFSIHHVPRDQNSRADILANKAIDKAS